jgi:hypothetical protein
MEPTIEQEAPAVRPIEVTRAVQLLTSALVIGFIASAIRLRGQVSGTTLVVALLILIVFLTIFFYLIRKISAGRNWARLVLLVLVLLGTPFAIPAYIAEVSRNVVPGTLSIIIIILQVIATVLLFLKNSNRWFRSHQ